MLEVHQYRSPFVTLKLNFKTFRNIMGLSLNVDSNLMYCPPKFHQVNFIGLLVCCCTNVRVFFRAQSLGVTTVCSNSVSLLPYSLQECEMQKFQPLR